jgi:hypothetical protein
MDKDRVKIFLSESTPSENRARFFPVIPHMILRATTKE